MEKQVTSQTIPGRPQEMQAEKIMQPMTKRDSAAEAKMVQKIMYAVYALLILLGIGTGYLLSQTVGARVTGSGPSYIQTEKVAGVTDTQTFKDSAEGTIEKGGIDGEGTHKLVRDGGPSQTAFLISSVVDLDTYVGKKVKVWGQTFAAKKAAWLMDVGRVELQ